MKIGDKVRFLNEVGGGTVSKITNSNMVHVMDNDGFEIPVLASDLVVVESSNEYQRRNTAPAKEEKKEINIVPEKKESILYVDGDEYELSLAFVPKNQTDILNSDIDVFFINDSSYYCMYAVSLWTKYDKLTLLNRNDIEPEMKEHLYTMERADLNSKLSLNITAFLYKHKKEYKLYPPEQVNVELNPIKFVKTSSFTENDFFDEKAYIVKLAVNNNNSDFEIDPKELEKAIKEKKDIKRVTPALKNGSEIEEIDLHIEELIDNAQGLDNGQIVDIQLARFTTALELGISAKTKRMVFIHGVGNGKLKHEIRRLLDTQYAGKVRYQDASFQEYGYGATMVMI